MRTYTKKYLNTLKPKVFCTWKTGVPVYIKAYLKENALKRLQEIDPSLAIKGDDVFICRQMVNSHQAPVDEVVQVSKTGWQVKYMNLKQTI